MTVRVIFNFFVISMVKFTRTLLYIKIITLSFFYFPDPLQSRHVIFPLSQLEQPLLKQIDEWFELIITTGKFFFRCKKEKGNLAAL